MKPAKEWLNKFFEQLHPNSTDEQFEKLIKRIQRDVLYSSAFTLSAKGDTMINAWKMRDEFITMAAAIKNPEEKK